MLCAKAVEAGGSGRLRAVGHRAIAPETARTVRDSSELQAQRKASEPRKTL
ncbi:hypothetical protein [Thermoleptolyngbya sp. M55_K2018_002]|uniref:hypothetical protein n=1 Tax=Thermoleptolyngbya sp. M55_K2018_002 TaxID=2747808 RepID=UPI0025EB1D2B|nr:hypothetical protein [Thermoleptolyngbya sp. M55_K2018_002]